MIVWHTTSCNRHKIINSLQSGLHGTYIRFLSPWTLKLKKATNLSEFCEWNPPRCWKHLTVGSFRLTLSLQDMIRHDCILPSVVEPTSIPQETACLWTPRFLFAVIHVSGKNDQIWEESALGKLIHWDPQRLKIVHRSIKKEFLFGNREMMSWSIHCASWKWCTYP